MYFDSPATKHLPKTPSTATPVTPGSHGQLMKLRILIHLAETQGAGWMISAKSLRLTRWRSSGAFTTILSPLVSFPARPTTTFSKYVNMPCARRLTVGWNHASMGGHGKQERRQVGHPSAKGQEQGCHRQDVALHGERACDSPKRTHYSLQMLAAIGETFETPLPKEGDDSPVPVQSDLVTGVIVSARPGL